MNRLFGIPPFAGTFDAAGKGVYCKQKKELPDGDPDSLQEGIMNERILIVEDDRALSRGLEFTLGNQGYRVLTADTLSRAEAVIREAGTDLLLLDIGLPDGSGFDLCRRVRSSGEIFADLPVIFLTACDEEVHVVMGLDLGGDDYITKPFRVNELLSRIQAVLRRRNGRQGIRNLEEGLTVDMDRHTVLRDGQTVPLTSTEYRLLRFLYENRGAVLLRERILEQLWDTDGHFVDENTLSVYIRRLREKLEEDPGNPRYIETVRGLGYRWK